MAAPAVAGNPQPATRQRRFSALWLIIPFVLVAAYFLSFGHLFYPGRSIQNAREGTASALINQLSQAAKVYQIDHDAFPPGDGQGSSELAAILSARGPKKFPYFEFGSDMRDARGNVINPVDPDRIVFYRCPGIQNPKSFDLWCEDAKGRVDGINNWGK